MALQVEGKEIWGVLRRETAKTEVGWFDRTGLEKWVWEEAEGARWSGEDEEGEDRDWWPMEGEGLEVVYCDEGRVLIEVGGGWGFRVVWRVREGNSGKVGKEGGGEEGRERREKGQEKDGEETRRGEDVEYLDRLCGYLRWMVVNLVRKGEQDVLRRVRDALAHRVYVDAVVERLCEGVWGKGAAKEGKGNGGKEDVEVDCVAYGEGGRESLFVLNAGGLGSCCRRMLCVRTSGTECVLDLLDAGKERRPLSWSVSGLSQLDRALGGLLEVLCAKE